MKRVSLLMVAALLCLAGKSFAQSNQATENLDINVPSADILTLSNNGALQTMYIGAPASPGGGFADGTANDTYNAQSNDSLGSLITAQFSYTGYTPATGNGTVTAWPAGILVLNATFTPSAGTADNAGTTELDTCAGGCNVVENIPAGNSSGGIAYDVSDNGQALSGDYTVSILYTLTEE